MPKPNKTTIIKSNKTLNMRTTKSKDLMGHMEAIE